MKRYQFLLFFLLIFISCQKDNPIKITEDDPILILAYDREYIYPEGFFHEINLEGSVYYENTISIYPLSERDDVWIELSTNDKSEALSWSNLSDEYSSQHRVLISERETKKYFEFKRQDDNNDVLLSRVHKTSYFQPMLNHFSNSDTIGLYNGELSIENAKELIEYLWDCGSFGLFHSKVLESKIQEYDSYYEHFIKSILIVHGDFNVNDLVHVYDNYLKLDKTNRILTLNSFEVDTIVGHDN